MRTMVTFFEHIQKYEIYLETTKPLINDREFVQKLVIDLDVDRNGWINEAKFIDGLLKNKVCKEYLAGFV